MENYDPTEHLDKNDRPQNRETRYQALPNSTPVLFMGIFSIVLCWLYGFLSLVLGIIALVLASSAEKDYRQNPHLYSLSSYKNMRAGRTCAIVGLCLGAFSFILIMFWMLMFGAAMFSFFSFSTH